MRSATYSDFEKAAAYICSVCGYPAVTTDKLKVLMQFMQENHGRNTLDDLQNAFISLAAGRLDEKMDNIKSLTGLSASRVLQAYRRNISQHTPDEYDPNRSRMTEENIELIKAFNGRPVFYNDEVTKEEHDYLMDYWINESKEQYKRHRRADLLTETAFNHLKNKGLLKIDDGVQVNLGTWQTTVTGATLKQLATQMKSMEDSMGSGGFRRMLSPSAGRPIESCYKRVAVASYFDTI